MSLYLTNVDIMGNTKNIEENQSQTNKIELDEININTQSDKIILNEEIKEKKHKIKKKKKPLNYLIWFYILQQIQILMKKF